MRIFTLSAALALGLPLAAQESAEKLDVSVLYAGAKDSSRTAVWKRFLSKTFIKVASINLTELSKATASDFDVVIVDSPSPYRGPQGFEMPKAPQIGLDFTKPTILMGAAGGKVLTGLKIKLNWL